MSVTRERRFVRGLALVAAGGLAVLTLSGCLSVNAAVDINSDAKASGTFAVGVEKQAAQMLGMTDLAAFEAGLQNPDMTAGSGDLLSGDCTSSETDTEFVYTCKFTDTDFSASGTENPWTITKDGDAITFTMVNEGSTGDDASADLLGGGSLGTITVNVTFPGEITSITGEKVTKTSDTSATVSAAASDPVNVTITSKSSGGGGGAIGKILLIAGIALLVIIVIALIAFLVMRGRKSPPAAPAVAAAPAAAAVAMPAVAETVVAEPLVTEAVVAETVVAEPVVEEVVVAEPVVEGAVVEEAVVEDTAVQPPADTPAADQPPQP